MKATRERINREALHRRLIAAEAAIKRLEALVAELRAQITTRRES